MKYTVTDPTTNKSVDLEGDSPPNEQELEQIFSTVHGQSPQQSQYGLKDAIGDIGRPLLEGGGAFAGGLLAAPLGPIGAAAGGALGFGAGKAGADLLDRSLGRMEPIPDLSSAVKETGNDLYQGAQAEATGQVAGRVIPSVLKGAGKIGSQLGEWATGIPEKNFKTVAENPMAMRPQALPQAGEKFRTAMSNAGISSELTPEAVDRMRHPGQYAFDTFNKLKTEGSISPQEALHARQSIDAAYPIPNPKNASHIRMLDQMRDEFQNVIANASPELQAASKDYAIAKAGSSFQHILPQTRSGKPSYIRGGAILGGLASGHPAALLGVPAVAGTIAAGAGSAGSLAKSIFKNPAAARGVTGAILGSNPISKLGVMNDSNKPPQTLNGKNNSTIKDQSSDGGINPSVDHTSPILSGNEDNPQANSSVINAAKTQGEKLLFLTKEKAREFLNQANGVKELARELARKAGYSW